MKLKAGVAQGEEEYSAQTNLQFTPPWPKWNDADIDSEKWNSDTVFEDPFGHGNVPLGVEVAEWKRVLSFNYESPPVIVLPEEDYVTSPDLITPNVHILHIPLNRFIITNIMNLQHLAHRDPFTIELNGAQVSESRRTTWRPWHHIYSNCSSKEFPLPNENGKYIVRIYYLGSWRKVTVDDYIPVDKNNKILLPTSNIHNELWPLIIAKAILRVAFVCLRDEKDTSDFDVIMLLTGWIGKELTVSKIPPQTIWRQFRKLIKGKTDEIEKIEETNEEKQSGKGVNDDVITDSNVFLSPVLELRESRKESICSLKVRQESFTEVFGKSPIFAVFPTITEALEPFEKLTPCLSHPIILTEAEDVEYGTELRQLPHWKFYRWVDWAVSRKILSHAICTFVKSVKFYSAYTCRTLPALKEAEDGLLLYNIEGNINEIASEYKGYIAECYEQISIHDSEKMDNNADSGDRQKYVKHHRLRSQSRRESFKLGRLRASPIKYSTENNENKYIVIHNNHKNGQHYVETETETKFPNFKDETPRDLWCDIENILNHVSKVNIYYKLSSFPYIARIPQDSPTEEHATLKKKHGSQNFSLSSTPCIQQETNLLFLVIDSQESKSIFMNLSVLLNNASEENTSDFDVRLILHTTMNITAINIKNCYVIGEKYNWRKRTIDEDYFILNANVSRSIIIRLNTGLNVFRLWTKLAPHYSLIFASEEQFTICTLEKMQDITSNPSKPLLQHAGKIVDKFKKVVSEANKKGEKYNEKRHKNAVEVFRKSYLPEIYSNYSERLADDVFHIAFENSAIKVMNKVVHGVPDFKSAVENIRRITFDKDFGSEIFDEILHKKEEIYKLEQHFHLSGMFVSIRMAKQQKARLGKSDKSKSVSAPSLDQYKQKPKNSDITSGKQNNLVLDQILPVVDIVEGMIAYQVELRNYYTLCDDIDHHIKYVDYEGNCRIDNRISEWTPVTRVILNIHNDEEDTLCSVHCACSTPFYIFIVIDNATLKCLDKLFGDIPVSLFQKNVAGYTAIIFVFPKNITNTNISWKIRVLGARTSSIPHLCSWKDNHLCAPVAPPTLTIIKLQNMYTPNSRNVIYESVLTVKRKQIFTIRITLSDPNVSFESRVTDHKGDILSNEKGVGNIMIPVLELIPESAAGPADNENRFKFYLQGVVLYDSWYIPEKDKVSDNIAHTSKSKSTPTLKPMTEKLMEQETKSLDDNTDEVADILGTEYWVIQIFVDSDKASSVTLDLDMRKEAKLNEIREKFEKDPVRHKKAIKLRRKFIKAHGFDDNTLDVQYTPKLPEMLRNYSKAEGKTENETILVDQIKKNRELKDQERKEAFEKEISICRINLEKINESQSNRISRSMTYLEELRFEADNEISKAHLIIENYVHINKNNAEKDESKKKLKKKGKKKNKITS